MDKKRLYEIVGKREIKDIYYDDNPVWIQEIDDKADIAKVGFLDGHDKDVFIKDLYENC